MRAKGIKALLTLLMALLASGAAPAARAQGENPVIPAVLGEARLELEMAASPGARYLGLSGRRGLPPGRGMAFAYPYLGRWRMVMRDMLFALDFVWVREGVVVGVTPRVPPPRGQEPPREVGPPTEVDMILELPAGWAETHGVGPGARLVLLNRP